MSTPSNVLNLDFEEQKQLVELLKKLRNGAGQYIYDHTNEDGFPDAGEECGVAEAKRTMDYCHEIIDLITLSW